MRKSMTELKKEMRAVARGERRASPLPAAPLLAALSREALACFSHGKVVHRAGD